MVPFEALPWTIRSLFSSYVEIHSAELGIIVGFVVTAFLHRNDDRIALGLLVAALAFAFGGADVVCSGSSGLCSARAIRAKPWYFSGALMLSVLVYPRGLSLLLDHRSEADPPNAPADVARTTPGRRRRSKRDVGRKPPDSPAHASYAPVQRVAGGLEATSETRAVTDPPGTDRSDARETATDGGVRTDDDTASTVAEPTGERCSEAGAFEWCPADAGSVDGTDPHDSG